MKYLVYLFVFALLVSSVFAYQYTQDAADPTKYEANTIVWTTNSNNYVKSTSYANTNSHVYTLHHSHYTSYENRIERTQDYYDWLDDFYASDDSLQEWLQENPYKYDYSRDDDYHDYDHYKKYHTQNTYKYYTHKQYNVYAPNNKQMTQQQLLYNKRMNEMNKNYDSSYDFINNQ